MELNQRRTLEELIRFVRVVTPVIEQSSVRANECAFALDALVVWVGRHVSPDKPIADVMADYLLVKCEMIACAAMGQWLHAMWQEAEKTRLFREKVMGEVPAGSPPRLSLVGRN